jgi:hypothetical protein
VRAGGIEDSPCKPQAQSQAWAGGGEMKEPISQLSTEQILALKRYLNALLRECNYTLSQREAVVEVEYKFVAVE